MGQFRESVSRLADAQKRRSGVSLYSRFVNRPIGRVLAAAGHVLGLKPNAVTALSAAATLAGLVVLVLAPREAWAGAAVAALLMLGFALDSADGQLARLRGGGSAQGEWLDHVVDAGKTVAVHTAVLLALVTDGAPPPLLMVALAFQFVAIVIYAGGTLHPLLQRGSAPAAPPSTVRAIALLPADYGVLALSFATWGVVAAFDWIYVALFAANAAIGLLLCAKWFRSLDSGSGSVEPGVQVPARKAEQQR